MVWFGVALGVTSVLLGRVLGTVGVERAELEAEAAGVPMAMVTAFGLLDCFWLMAARVSNSSGCSSSGTRTCS